MTTVLNKSSFNFFQQLGEMLGDFPPLHTSRIDPEYPMEKASNFTKRAGYKARSIFNLIFSLK